MSLLRGLVRQRAGLALTGFVVLVLLLQQGSRPAPPGVCVLGDARAFHNGVVPPDQANQVVDAQHFSAGLGVASVRDWRSLGEALAFDGTLYTRVADPEARDYYRLRHNQHFRTSSFAAVPRATVARARLNARSGQTFAELWRDIGAQFPDGALVVGLVEFQALHTLAISRPATQGLPVFSASTLYYTEPMESHHGVLALVVGLAARHTVLATRANDPLVAQLIARRPDSRPDLYAQALVLDAPATHTLAQLARPLPALSVGRVAASSIVQRGELLIYPATQLGRCADLLGHPAVRPEP